jgi:DNA-binding response OmpR family regulator
MDKALILYVDDEPGALETMKDALVEKGYDVLQATNGAEALALLKAKTPDIILADLRMQPVNGFELFQAIKKNPRFLKTPVFFLTAVDDPLAQKYGESLGVDAYLTKPVDIDHLDNIIRGRLGLR